MALLSTPSRISQHVLKWAKTLAERVVGMEVRSKHVYPHLKRLHAWSSDDVIFDVGANDGRTIDRLHEHLPHPQIFAFEPVVSTFQTLVEHTKDFDNVRCFNCAFGARSGRRKIYLNEEAAVHSFDPTWGASHATETVDVTTVDEVRNDLGVPLIHFLKLDVEGHELDVLKGAEEALAGSRIAMIQVEAGVGQHERDFVPLERFRSYLSEFGYGLYGIFNQTRRRVEAPSRWFPEETRGFDPKLMTYCDAVFVRTERLKQLS